MTREVERDTKAQEAISDVPISTSESVLSGPEEREKDANGEIMQSSDTETADGSLTRKEALGAMWRVALATAFLSQTSCIGGLEKKVFASSSESLTNASLL